MPNQLKVKISAVIFLTFIILIPSFSSALTLVPQCSPASIPGKSVAAVCTICDLFVLIQNILSFAWTYIAFPIAALMLAYGGFMMLVPGATGAGSVEKGKKIITNTLIGIAIIFLAWLGIDTIMKAVGGYQFGPWNKINCTAKAISIGGGGIVPGGKNLGNGFKCGDNTQCASGFCASQSSAYCSAGACCAASNGAPGDTGMVQTYSFSGSVDGAGWKDGYDINSPEALALLNAPPEGQSWDQNIKYTNCTVSTLNPYDAQINSAASAYGVDSARLQSIIMAESSGNNNAVHQDLDGKSSYGLMQIRPDTARHLDSANAGLSDAQIAAKLRDSGYNIQLGTKYYSGMLSKYGGNQDLASAAYNGGPGANNSSVNCPGMLRWQCQWDNNAHTVPNTGYNPTRRYINNINTMQSSIKSGAC